MNYRNNYSNLALRHGRISLMEILVGVAVVVVIGAIAFSVIKSSQAKKQLAVTNTKMKALGDAFRQFHIDNGGLLPLEDTSGRDDWDAASEPEAAHVWYNALPKLLGAPAVGDLVGRETEFYEEGYPLYIPGAPYPESNKKLTRPYFAIGMNSRLQRKAEDGTEKTVTFSAILKPANTVIFLERGLPGDKKVSKIQKGFDGKAKANPQNFAARHNQQGILLFADGHTEQKALSELIETSGLIIEPQETIVWTPDPDDDPN